MLRFALLVVLLTSACAASTPAPISYGGSGPRSDRDVVSAPPPPAFPVRASPSEDAPRTRPQPQPAPDWAEGEGTPLSAYALQPNEVQPYDPARLPGTHRVGSNETLYDVATRYQIPLLALIGQNGLEPPYALTPGRVLSLPPPRFHTVDRGESFEDIAQRYQMDTRSLALLNRMQPPYRVRAGDRIVLPAVAVSAAAPASEAVPRRPAGPTTPQIARFVMPVEGEIVTRFGAQPGGARVDGVEIAAREGARIVAAADGDVVYAGADLEAYGTLVLIRHADNFVTAYGYARRALVSEGQRVRAGQAIAELGARGDGRPRLLFQVRRGAAAVDPAPLLGLAD